MNAITLIAPGQAELLPDLNITGEDALTFMGGDTPLQSFQDLLLELLPLQAPDSSPDAVTGVPQHGVKPEREPDADQPAIQKLDTRILPIIFTPPIPQPDAHWNVAPVSVEPVSVEKLQPRAASDKDLENVIHSPRQTIGPSVAQPLNPNPDRPSSIVSRKDKITADQELSEPIDLAKFDVGTIRVEVENVTSHASLPMIPKPDEQHTVLPPAAAVTTDAGVPQYPVKEVRNTFQVITPIQPGGKTIAITGASARGNADRDLPERRGNSTTPTPSAEPAPSPALSFGSEMAPANDIAHAEKVLPPRPPELPWMPPAQVAHRVSIDVGGDDSPLRITLHERAGDVSLKFDTATDTLRTDLQSSVGSLIEALKREHVPLANLDFANSLGNPADPEQRRQQPHRPAVTIPRRVSRIANSSITEFDSSSNGINIQA
jgi:hypothetical protein